MPAINKIYIETSSGFTVILKEEILSLNCSDVSLAMTETQTLYTGVSSTDYTIGSSRLQANFTFPTSVYKEVWGIQYSKSHGFCIILSQAI